MPDQTPILSLPLILPAQAQKHVTHNEALRLLDVLVQLVVADRTLTAPPASPQEGARHIIAAGATGEWAARDGQIAAFWDNAWLYLVPQDGWVAFVRAEGTHAIHVAGTWLADHEQGVSFPNLGINATADTVNRLSVNSDASLLNHDGAGHQLKLNKAGTTETASLLYQSAFSGRAEIGLAGNDALSIKVSPDGTNFQEAMVIDQTSANVTLPGQVTAGGVRFQADPTTGLSLAAIGQMEFATAGTVRATLETAALQLNVPLVGLAVTQSQIDPTPGRVLRVGDFGLGANASPDFDADDTNLPSVMGRMTSGTRPDGNPWHALHLSRVPLAESAQLAIRDGTAASHSQLATRHRDSSGTWSSWNPLYGQRNILGTVGLAAGQVTGAILERGTNANGEYIRFADGTQICWHSLSVPNINSQVGALFQSTLATWSFAAAFLTSPNVTGAAEGSQHWLGLAPPSLTSVQFRALSPLSVNSASNCRMLAIGRWA